MKINSISIKNFRGYQGRVDVQIDNLTVFIGKNDAGKSTLLDALNIFFNGAKIDSGDVNQKARQSHDLDIEFRVRFSQLPDAIDIDAGNSTTLKAEYLLNHDGELEVIKRYKDGAKARVFVLANHPQNDACKDLLLKKNSDLKKIIDELGLECDKTKNAEMRKAIWDYHTDDLRLGEVEIEIDSKSGELKALWEKLAQYMPVYSLFKSDRTNDEKDNEIQDPLKEAVKQIFKESTLREAMDAVSNEVRRRVEEVAQRTLVKLNEMSPNIANTLHPVLPSPKWEDLFKGISITGDEDIPIGKRGSGVRRMVLLNFFRAEVERLQDERNTPNVIYAIEEPETSQHADFQQKLIIAFKELSTNSAVQVFLTTHSSHIVKSLDFSSLRLISNNQGAASVSLVAKGVLPYPSLNEVNYVAFDREASVEYHNELYGHLQSLAMQEDLGNEKEKDFERWLASKGVSFSKRWKRIFKGAVQPPYDCTLFTYVRNCIHHPENRENDPYTSSELKQSIDDMAKLVSMYS